MDLTREVVETLIKSKDLAKNKKQQKPGPPASKALLEFREQQIESLGKFASYAALLGPFRGWDVSQNYITAIPGDFAAHSRLEEFHISENLLADMAGFNGNMHLRVLNLSNNQLKRIEGLDNLPELRVLVASASPEPRRQPPDEARGPRPAAARGARPEPQRPRPAREHGPPRERQEAEPQQEQAARPRLPAAAGHQEAAVARSDLQPAAGELPGPADGGPGRAAVSAAGGLRGQRARSQQVLPHQDLQPHPPHTPRRHHHQALRPKRAQSTPPSRSASTKTTRSTGSSSRPTWSTSSASTRKKR